MRLIIITLICTYNQFSLVSAKIWLHYVYTYSIKLSVVQWQIIFAFVMFNFQALNVNQVPFTRDLKQYGSQKKVKLFAAL